MKTDQVKKEFTLDRFEGDKAVLLDENDEQLVLPSFYLPKNAKEGEILVLSIQTLESEKKQREQKAKDLLNEILNPKDF
jgi:hypothetical protein